MRIKRNGFTLIELLAVITLIALLSILVIPNITENIKEKETEISLVNEKMIYNATDLYIENNKNNYSNNFEANGSTYCIAIQSLINNDILETPIKNADGKEIDYSKIIKATYNSTYNSFDYEIVNNNECIEVVNYVNKPLLKENMIPVVYNDKENAWVKADINSKWYNYSEKKWANVVLVNNEKDENVVNSKSRFEYLNSPIGTKILETDILAYFVWIPRYRYQLFNPDSPNEINIVFENVSSAKSKGTQNGEWLTHPAFTFENKELTGIWVGKFETGNTNEQLVIKPNVVSWRNVNVEQAFSLSKSLTNNENIYGLKNIDSYMTKNSEWAAVAYLSHSKYGINTEVRINNNKNYITGCGAFTENSSESDTCEIKFYENYEYPQSTTGNITGIFDMNGGSMEYVMSGLNDGDNKLYSGRNNILNSGFNGKLSAPETALTDNNGSPLENGDANITEITDKVNIPDKKYYDLYINPNVLGHALYEVDTWYDDENKFINTYAPWLIRGGFYNQGNNAGIFNYNNTYGNNQENVSFRISLS